MPTASLARIKALHQRVPTNYSFLAHKFPPQVRPKTASESASNCLPQPGMGDGKSGGKSKAEKQPHASPSAAAPSDDASIAAASNTSSRSLWISAVLKPMEKQSEPLATGARGCGSTAPQCSALANVGTKSPPVGASVQASRAGPSRHVSVMDSLSREYSPPHTLTHTS